MHVGFNFDPRGKSWLKYLKAGKEIHSANKNIVKSNLGKLKNADGILEATKIIESWFPALKASVFLSHSHKDEDIVVGLAGWLKETFGIESFIDSIVWGYSDELLRLIDDEYCMDPPKETYIYRKRNRSTSHVHMMLSTALMGMIDQCECIIFVNTPSSFTPNDYFETRGETESPWIYSEIAMTRMLRKRSPLEHRRQYASESASLSLEHLQESKDLSVIYPTDLLHLTPLSPDDLDDWAKFESNGMRKANALDSLYSAKKI
ncbi:hypothetical protein [Comamonas sp. JUb58]|uniref:hypothetical protein n=1 Tax=Comamonas sp. JUb58 TaxID=2485114 RepID=UPI00105CDEC1|nr:hypothetical protein [Comamonas sp. JUb58]TDS82142.1 hypothetical protein EDF71_10858 [Comamonas sp. JUb58]